MKNFLLNLLFISSFFVTEQILASKKLENDLDISSSHSSHSQMKESSASQSSSDSSSLLDSDSEYSFSSPQLDSYQNEQYQVRFQIRSDLEVLKINPEKIEFGLSSPVLCAGTGTSIRAMHFSGGHPHMTVVEEKDTTIDANNHIRPHFTKNIWQVSEQEDDIKARGPFGVVYFAHVGSGFPKNAQEALNTYGKILYPGGIFLYKSFVYLKEAFTQGDFFDEFSPQHPTFNILKKHYRKVLRRAGLRHVKIILRDESFFGYSAPLASLMVYAKKPLSTSKR